MIGKAGSMLPPSVSRLAGELESTVRMLQPSTIDARPPWLGTLLPDSAGRPGTEIEASSKSDEHSKGNKEPKIA